MLRPRRWVPRPRNPVEDEVFMLERLRAGDEAAFVTLVGRHHDSMLRLARTFVNSDAVAEEVVQETWLCVLRGIDRFEGRSALRTWLLSILINRARSTGAREARTVPAGDREPAVEPSRFDLGGFWSSPPEHWADAAVERLSAGTLRGVIRDVLMEMPARQCAVVMLRDVDGLRSDEVCDVLELTPANERVLLHRGRSRLRQALEDTIAPVL